MGTLLVLTLLYFLPAIVGHNKRDAAGIFVLNLLLGWTIIGWVIAMVWACSSAPRMPAIVIAGHGCYCPRCGAVSVYGAHYCSACGRPL